MKGSGFGRKRSWPNCGTILKFYWRYLAKPQTVMFPGTPAKNSQQIALEWKNTELPIFFIWFGGIQKWNGGIWEILEYGLGQHISSRVYFGFPHTAFIFSPRYSKKSYHRHALSLNWQRKALCSPFYMSFFRFSPCSSPYMYNGFMHFLFFTEIVRQSRIPVFWHVYMTA